MTGTVALMHVLATAEPASRATERADLANIFAVIQAGDDSACSVGVSTLNVC